MARKKRNRRKNWKPPDNALNKEQMENFIENNNKKYGPQPEDKTVEDPVDLPDTLSQYMKQVIRKDITEKVVAAATKTTEIQNQTAEKDNNNFIAENIAEKAEEAECSSSAIEDIDYENRNVEQLSPKTKEIFMKMKVRRKELEEIRFEKKATDIRDKAYSILESKRYEKDSNSFPLLPKPINKDIGQAKGPNWGPNREPIQEATELNHTTGALKWTTGGPLKNPLEGLPREHTGGEPLPKVAISLIETDNERENAQIHTTLAEKIKQNERKERIMAKKACLVQLKVRGNNPLLITPDDIVEILTKTYKVDNSTASRNIQAVYQPNPTNLSLWGVLFRTPKLTQLVDRSIEFSKRVEGTIKHFTIHPTTPTTTVKITVFSSPIICDEEYIDTFKPYGKVKKVTKHSLQN